MTYGPFDLSGGAFLQLYGVLLAAAILLSIVIPRWLRPEGAAPRQLDTDSLAFIAGGGPRVAESVATGLLERGDLAMIGKRRFHARRTGGATAGERAVLALPGEQGWGAIERAAGRGNADIRRRLIADGVMIEPGEQLQLRFFQTLPLILLIGFGAVKLMVGEARGRPIGYLTTLVILTGLIALIRFVMLDPLTREGRGALTAMRARSDRLRRAPVGGEAALGVALFGTVVLAGSEWDDLHQLRAQGGGDGGSSDSGSDGGSSGCGGGGCGGCGS